MHTKLKNPASIYIKKVYDRFTVSFCYEDNHNSTKWATAKSQLNRLSKLTEMELISITEGIDLGVSITAQGVDNTYDYSEQEKNRLFNLERKRKRYQRKMAKQTLGSLRRRKTKKSVAKTYQTQANIRNDFCHKSSHSIVHKTNKEVIVFEDLKTKNMTKRPAVKRDDQGRYLKNRAAAKAGLNKAILNKGWHKLALYTQYKCHRAGKAFFKVSPHYSSQECADCGHIHPDNRETQAVFACKNPACGKTENADLNAARVIKKRAIKLILHSGTELSDKGLLTLSDKGRGDRSKTKQAKANLATVEETSKKIESYAIAA